MKTVTESDVVEPALAPNSGGGEPEPRARGSYNWDRQLALALILAAAVIFPRSISTAVNLSGSYDDQYHLKRGLAFLTRSLSQQIRAARGYFEDDPQLSQGLSALPLLTANLLYGRASQDPNLYTHPLGHATLAALIALWKSLLFLPLVGVVFAWCRSLYGARSAWLATTLLIVEPSFAAHIPLASVDVLGVTGIVLGAYAGWCFVERTTVGTAALVGFFTAFAVMMKHTAVILPAIHVAYAAVSWVGRPIAQGESWNLVFRAISARLRLITLAGLVALGSLWALTLFDVSPPYCVPKEPGAHGLKEQVKDVFRSDWPAGMYFHAFSRGFHLARAGHGANYLFGEHRQGGWWYYFPVLLTFKAPLGVGLLVLLTIFALPTWPLTYRDFSLLIPWAAWTLLVITSKIDIGFRHYFPAYIFLIMFVSRCVVIPGLWRSRLAWTAVATVAVQAALYHPHYISYLNFPRNKPYLSIGDSNLDWGQSLPEVRHWLDSHQATKRPVYVAYYGRDKAGVEYYLTGHAVVLGRRQVPTENGMLIISPSLLAIDSRFRALRQVDPDEVIGHGSMLVYDLARFGGTLPFEAPVGHPGNG
jgi:hypothetical protein